MSAIFVVKPSGRISCARVSTIRLPEDLVASCKITLTPSPLLVATERVERYRAGNERIPLAHVRLEFPSLVHGPLLVGDRRYFGYGLFVPGDQQSRAFVGIRSQPAKV